MPTVEEVVLQGTRWLRATRTSQLCLRAPISKTHSRDARRSTPSTPTTTREVSLADLMGQRADILDYFDRLQLQAVIAVCRKHHALSDAGRELFQVSRTQRSVVNDADRLRKYLLRFGLTWGKVTA